MKMLQRAAAVLVLFPLFAEAEQTVFRLENPGATSVELAGEFNGWKPAPMERISGGVWTTSVDLAPGTYAYKFLVDGEVWVFDPANDARKTVEDNENSAVTVGAGADSTPAPGASSSASPLDLCRAIADALRPAIAGLAPAPQLGTNAPASLSVSYLARTFKTHAPSMTGEFAEEAREEVGPAAKGFILAAEIQKKGEVNQAVVPQTLRRPYWDSYVQVTPVSGSDLQIYWSLSYGLSADADLLARIRQAVESFGAARGGGAPE